MPARLQTGDGCSSPDYHCLIPLFPNAMTRPTPIFDILSRMDNESSGRSGCLVPLDDDWKERMRALNPNVDDDDKKQHSQEDK